MRDNRKTINRSGVYISNMLRNWQKEYVVTYIASRAHAGGAMGRQATISSSNSSTSSLENV